MKILIVSHNIFSKTESMGKTLSTYFSAFEEQNLAQFYIHSQIPTSNICSNYYNITDKEALKSIFTRKCGKIFGEKDIQLDATSNRTDSGAEAKIYQKARKRTPLIYFLRNAVWGLSAWNNKKLKNWVDDFNPDVVFLASGDYAFIYKIALKIAKRKNIPLVVSCMDDYYFNNKNNNKFGGKITHKYFMNIVKKTMNYASLIFSICETMNNEYSKFFGIESCILHTAASFDEPLSQERENKVSYLGNLGYKRNEQLVKLGKALKECDSEFAPKFIDVYSSENCKEILKDFKEENGIKFHGEVGAEEVRQIIGKSAYLIHTESFDNEIRKEVKYSVSTKIADSLMSGNCLIAFGPEEVASINYLKSNDAAFVITENDNITNSLNEIFKDANKYNKIQKNANMLAFKNHKPDTNASFVFEKLKEICNENITS